MSADVGCLLVLAASAGGILGLVLGFGFHDFLRRRIEDWLPPGFGPE